MKRFISGWAQPWVPAKPQDRSPPDGPPQFGGMATPNKKALEARASMLQDPDVAKAYEDATRPLWLVSKTKDKYDAVPESSLEEGEASKAKRFLNLAALRLPAVALNFVIPPLIFLLASVPLCSVVHYRMGRGVYIWLLLAAVPLALACLSFVRTKRKGLDIRWIGLSMFLFAAALVGGAILGEVTWRVFMKPFHIINSMKAYPDISPVDVPGQQIMDAGRVHFSSNTQVDLSMTMSFTDWSMYCVAPIVDRNLPMEKYDYWAVGTDCCSTDDLSFRCGDIDSATARSGLRDISEDHRTYFRLAVQQAEAAYGIHAQHPIFFYWVEDPLKLIGYFYEDGFKHWMCACVMHFALNTAVLIGATVAFIHPKDSAGLATLGL
mmetsp:Transcript_64335/g.119591  ORF Transcript_64335/g.119591 Transcript_64335/m.119591 type:complete len:379 (-) Transcript_64335:50-1186(-)